MKKNKPQKEIGYLLDGLFFTLFIFHLFISGEQNNVWYIIVLGIYFTSFFVNKKNVQTIFLSSLVLILVIPVLVLLNSTNASLIAADYVYLLVFGGLLVQFIRILCKEKKLKD